MSRVFDCRRGPPPSPGLGNPGLGMSTPNPGLGIPVLNPGLGIPVASAALGRAPVGVRPLTSTCSPPAARGLKSALGLNSALGLSSALVYACAGALSRPIPTTPSKSPSVGEAGCSEMA